MQARMNPSIAASLPHPPLCRGERTGRGSEAPRPTRRRSVRGGALETRDHSERAPGRGDNAAALLLAPPGRGRLGAKPRRRPLGTASRRRAGASSGFRFRVTGRLARAAVELLRVVHRSSGGSPPLHCSSCLKGSGRQFYGFACRLGADRLCGRHPPAGEWCSLSCLRETVSPWVARGRTFEVVPDLRRLPCLTLTPASASPTCSTFRRAMGSSSTPSASTTSPAGSRAFTGTRPARTCT